MKKLLIVCGDEGAGKSTFAKKIVPFLKNGASFDAENILQVNPFEFNKKFIKLAIANSVDLIHNFFEAGYEQVVAGSFISTREEFDVFNSQLAGDPEIYILQLTAEKFVRDDRRLKREKPTDQKQMDWMDINWPTSNSLAETAGDGSYSFFRLDNSELPIDQAIQKVKEGLSGFFL